MPEFMASIMPEHGHRGAGGEIRAGIVSRVAENGLRTSSILRTAPYTFSLREEPQEARDKPDRRLPAVMNGHFGLWLAPGDRAGDSSE